MPKPKVTTNCVANQYTDDNERIIEYSDPVTKTGGLIAFRRNAETGVLMVDLYQHDAAVEIRVGQSRET